MSQSLGSRLRDLSTLPGHKASILRPRLITRTGTGPTIATQLTPSRYNNTETPCPFNNACFNWSLLWTYTFHGL